jgi:hypothetical protein
VLSERLGKVLGALAIDQTWGISIVILSTTGLVDHELLDQLEELRIVSRELAGEETVHVLWGAELGSLIKKDDAVHVGKATLLELDYEDITNSLAKDAMLDVLD